MDSHASNVVYSEIIQKTDMKIINNKITGSSFSRLGPELLGPTSRLRDSLRNRLGGIVQENGEKGDQNDKHHRYNSASDLPAPFAPLHGPGHIARLVDPGLQLTGARLSGRSAAPLSRPILVVGGCRF